MENLSKMAPQPAQAKLPAPQERMDLILMGLSRQESIGELCRQAGVSRELFYRWMGRVRQAGMAALRVNTPGPKKIHAENPARTLQKSQERIRRMEKELRKVRQESDRWKRLAHVARRIIRRQTWGPFPMAGFKKNGMRAKRRATSIGGNGSASDYLAPRQESLPGAGTSIAPPTGAGSTASVNPFDPAAGG